MEIRGPRVKFGVHCFKEVTFGLNAETSCPLGERYIEILSHKGMK